jgi:hypothetical protein
VLLQRVLPALYVQGSASGVNLSVDFRRAAI